MQVKTDSEGRSEYIVVDGQQRITTILEFVGIGGRDPFQLISLEDDSEWQGYTFVELSDEEKKDFYGHPMAVRYLQEAEDSEIRDLFRRLNKYLTPLNPQELRNATYRGPFLRLSENIAEDEFWFETGLVKPAAIRRMKDIEFISDLLIGVLDGPQSASARTLDEYYAVLERYGREFPRQRECRRRFDKTREVIERVFPNLRGTRWSNRTDFYSLFVAIAHLLRERELPGDQVEEVFSRLDAFANEIRSFQEDENRAVADQVSDYVGAMRRGTSDQYRRGVRHRAILSVISPCFVERTVRGMGRNRRR